MKGLMVDALVAGGMIPAEERAQALIEVMSPTDLTPPDLTTLPPLAVPVPQARRPPRPRPRTLRTFVSGVNSALSGETTGMNVLSLFDGVAFSSSALQTAGVAVAREVKLRKFEDIKKTKAKDLPEIDLVIAGGFHDPQSKSFWEIVRLVIDCKPTWFVILNEKFKSDNHVETINKVTGFNVQVCGEMLCWTNLPGVEELTAGEADEVIADLLSPLAEPETDGDEPRQRLKSVEELKKVFEPAAAGADDRVISKQTLSFSCSKSMKWLRCPTDIWAELSAEFDFTIDLCASDANHLLPRYYTAEQDALKQDWNGEVGFCHPLFDSKIGRFVEKAAKSVGTFVFLLPASTHTKYFHDFFYQKPNVEVRYLRKPNKGFRFGHDDGTEDDPGKVGYIKPLMVCVMRNEEEEPAAAAAAAPGKIYNEGQFIKDDDYCTPLSAWQDIASFLPRDKVLWEAFYCDGASGRDLGSLGFQVIHEPVDFFEQNLGDIVVSNPPFSKKKEVLTRLKELEKPFVLLLPTNVVNKQYFRQLFLNDPELQIIIPRKRINFTKRGENTTNCWFDCVWVCWRMGLAREINWIGGDGGDGGEEPQVV